MFDESDTSEALVIKTLSDGDWEYIPSDQLNREYQDVILEEEFTDSLKRLNPAIAKSPGLADEVLIKIRTIISSAPSNGLISSNERLVEWLRNEKSMPFGRDGKHVTVKLIDYENPSNNSYIITNQVMFPFHTLDHGKALDIVLFVNGIPLVVGECKTPSRPSVSWADGAKDILDYQRSIPQFFVPNVFSFATEGKFYRYGSIGTMAEMWGPWHTSEDKEDGSVRSVRMALQNMLSPDTILDLLKNFTLFANDSNHRRIKTIARYQQFEGANAIVNRVLAGHPKKGLIWHFQGSGKSLLMVFAAQKLRSNPELNNPTVIVVVDRVELDSQISGTFAVSDIPNTQNIDSIKKLGDVLSTDVRKILITTIFKFNDIPKDLNTRSNIILLIDEAHRTQYGNLAMQMRDGLPNAFFFGLTGTPISKMDRDTFDVFGASEDPGGYMSKYTFQDSIRDNATLPLRFESVEVSLHVDRDKINADLEDLTEGLSEEETECLKRKASAFKHLITDPDRVRGVCKHIANHFRTKVEPAGFKAMVVTYDRECCVLYKRELDKFLPPEWSTIVMHTGSKNDEFKEWRLSKDQVDKVVQRYNDPKDSLKILIVTSRLITGFDSKILQTMYLDKPMKEHTLLQAVCRTNRPMPPNKDHGLIVDYLGLFDDVGDAFGTDNPQAGQRVVTNIDQLRESYPGLMIQCLAFFENVDRTTDSFTSLEAAQETLDTVEARDEFAKAFLVLHRVWEALSPDPLLSKDIKDYKWLAMVYNSLRPTSSMGTLVWQALGQKTVELIHDNVDLICINDDLESLVIDADSVDKILELVDPSKYSRKVEIKLIARLRKHKDDPEFIDLGKRLDELRELHELKQIESIEFLKRLLVIAKDLLDAEKKVETQDEHSRAKAALTELFNEIKSESTPIVVENIVNDIDKVVNLVRFAGWQDTVEGRRAVKKSIIDIVRLKYKIKDPSVSDKAYEYVEKYYPLTLTGSLDFEAQY